MAYRAGSPQIFKPRIPLGLQYFRTGLGETIHGHVHQAPVFQIMNSANNDQISIHTIMQLVLLVLICCIVIYLLLSN